MSNIVEDFNAYRSKMNERILLQENLVMKRLYNLDTNTYADGALNSKTKEMLGFSAEHNIVPDIEVINMSKINEAWDSMVAKQMSHRYVIDIENSFL